MKKFTLLIVLFLAVGVGLSAQPVDFDVFEQTIEVFADEVAEALPALAAVGLNWSHAYIGQFPHFGVGATAGGAFIPFEVFDPVLEMVGVPALPAQIAWMESYGIPFPAASIDARLGGFALPFDLGFKFMFIPPAVQERLGSFKADYLLLGGDIRFAILKDQGSVPALSIGVGYTYLRATVGIPNVAPSQELDITEEMNAAGYLGTHTLTVNSPSVDFYWQTNTLDLKLQLSKNLLIFTPYVGLGASYGFASAGGGLSGLEVVYAGSADQALVDQTIASLGLTDTGFLVTASEGGFAFRVYGGVGFNIFFVKLDVGAMYDFLGQSYGGAVNLRLQF